MEKLSESMGEAVREAVAQVPWAMPILAGMAVAFVALVIVMTFWRLKKGSEVTIAGLVTLKPDEMVEQLKKDFDSLNEDDKQKTQILRLLNNLTIEISRRNLP